MLHHLLLLLLLLPLLLPAHKFLLSRCCSLPLAFANNHCSLHFVDIGRDILMDALGSIGTVHLLIKHLHLFGYLLRL